MDLISQSKHAIVKLFENLANINIALKSLLMALTENNILTKKK